MYQKCSLTNLWFSVSRFQSRDMHKAEICFVSIQKKLLYSKSFCWIILNWLCFHRNNTKLSFCMKENSEGFWRMLQWSYGMNGKTGSWHLSFDSLLATFHAVNPLHSLFSLFPAVHSLNSHRYLTISYSTAAHPNLFSSSFSVYSESLQHYSLLPSLSCTIVPDQHIPPDSQCIIFQELCFSPSL